MDRREDSNLHDYFVKSTLSFYEKPKVAAAREPYRKKTLEGCCTYDSHEHVVLRIVFARRVLFLSAFPFV